MVNIVSLRHDFAHSLLLEIDEAAVMTQQQHRFSNRFMPDTKRKSRPKSLPVANDYTPPSSRLKTNALARVSTLLV